MTQKRKRYIGWLKRMGQKRCAYCDRAFTKSGPRRMTADHVKPLSRGGYDKRKNIVACCYQCNQAKRSMTAGEFKAAQRVIQ